MAQTNTKKMSGKRGFKQNQVVSTYKMATSEKLKKKTRKKLSGVDLDLMNDADFEQYTNNLIRDSNIPKTESVGQIDKIYRIDKMSDAAFTRLMDLAEGR